jgi:hypothetical protein
MKVDERREVTLIIERSGDDWWNVHIPDMTGSDFAMTSARTLDLALRGAVPYIACATDDVSDGMARLVAAAGDHDA